MSNEATNPVGKQREANQAGPERTRGNNYFTPQVDIYETDGELFLYADMPGVMPEDVELNYERGELRLSGRVSPRSHPGRLLLAEFEEGDYFRSFNIHESVDSTKIEASCKGGVVTVRLPKAAAAQPRQIKVQAG
jgi:HSP20 family protein